MSKSISKYLSQIGREGGKKSRRTLTTEQSRSMLVVREAKRAYKKFYASCFWSYDPNLTITKNDVAWIRTQLMKNGNRLAWETASKLCL